MTEWRALSEGEVTDLATRLRSLEWSWQVADGPELAERFGWRVLLSEPEWVLLDTGLGTGSGEIRGEEEKAVAIEVRVTEFADATERARTRDAFALMADALTDALGAPSARIPGEFPQIRWAGAESTLVLQDMAVSVVLTLVTNARLAADDRNAELEEQGLL
ncbi:DUF6301 family protein [Nocardia cyriacigeorgica]|uniref:DUF6301 family protein n=1 Tax=Nocardia cyriacigeorgica TaxID=135487 RepID=UPI002457A0AA|nr:DUF6301 family protein [Nocardia cyriacigeorgica]